MPRSPSWSARRISAFTRVFDALCAKRKPGARQGKPPDLCSPLGANSNPGYASECLGAGTKMWVPGSMPTCYFSRMACDLGAMASAQKFRGYMQDCMRWAETAQTEPDRHMLLRMAQTWEQAAQQIERSVGLICESRALWIGSGTIPACELYRSSPRPL